MLNIDLKPFIKYTQNKDNNRSENMMSNLCIYTTDKLKKNKKNLIILPKIKMYIFIINHGILKGTCEYNNDCFFKCFLFQNTLK
jgi:hypothetical protein